jgi:hypothetical protein
VHSPVVKTGTAHQPNRAFPIWLQPLSADSQLTRTNDLVAPAPVLGLHIVKEVHDAVLAIHHPMISGTHAAQHNAQRTHRVTPHSQ